MKFKKYLPFLFILLYSVLAFQFIFSNFIHVVGPHYTIKSSGYKMESYGFCPMSNNLNVSDGCVHSCPSLPVVSAPPSKGFPFAINESMTWCGDKWTIFDSSDFTWARLLNGVYIVGLSTLLFIGFKKSHNHA